jgi:hypothetical protein
LGLAVVVVDDDDKLTVVGNVKLFVLTVLGVVEIETVDDEDKGVLVVCAVLLELVDPVLEIDELLVVLRVVAIELLSVELEILVVPEIVELETVDGVLLEIKTVDDDEDKGVLVVCAVLLELVDPVLEIDDDELLVVLVLTVELLSGELDVLTVPEIVELETVDDGVNGTLVLVDDPEVDEIVESALVVTINMKKIIPKNYWLYFQL